MRRSSHFGVGLLGGLAAIVGGPHLMVAQNSAGDEYPTDRFFESDGAYLSYVIDLPQGTPPHPGVVLGHGSGRVTKDHLNRMARVFLSRGYAVLRFDKRGVGQSTGVYSGISTSNSTRMLGQLSRDMTAGFDVLVSHPHTDPGRIGFVGASQAGWIIPQAVAQRKTSAFAILISGPTVSVGMEGYYSRFAENTDTPLEQIHPQLTNFTGPHGYDPRPTLETIETPTLWLLGSLDRSIPVPLTVQILDEFIGRGKPFHYVLYPTGNHSLFETSSRTMLPFYDDAFEWLDSVWR